MRSPRRSLGILLTIAVIAAACGNAKVTVSNAGNSQGVTTSKVVVGGVASLTGPIPADFAPIFDGVNAYMDMINAEGGVDGRKIEFGYPLDDGSNASQDTDQVRTLVEQDHVFAVVGVGTPSFAGASYLVANDVPTFGYDVSTAWTDGPSLFGSEGSFLDFTRPGPEAAYLAEQLHARKVGVLAYNVGASEQAGEGMAYVMRHYHIPVAYEDLSIQAPPVDLTTDVNRDVIMPHHIGHSFASLFEKPPQYARTPTFLAWSCSARYAASGRGRVRWRGRRNPRSRTGLILQARAS